MRPAVLEARRVPVYPFALAVVAGTLAALYSNLSSGTLLFACAGLFLLSLASLSVRPTQRLAFFCVLVFFVAFSAYRTTQDLGRDVRSNVTQLSDTAEVGAIGRVIVPMSRNADRFAIVLSEAMLTQDSLRVDCGRLRIRVISDSAALAGLRCGDRIVAGGKLVTLADKSAGGTVGVRTMVTQREAAVLYTDSSGICTETIPGFWMTRSIERFRLFIQDTYDRRLSPDGAALCKALVLGDRGDFASDFSNDLRLTGLSHIFALSGMNVGFLLTAIWFLLGLLFVPRTARLWILLGFVLVYMELGRESPSLVRATIMAALFILGRLLYRQTDPLNSLTGALFIELLWRPLDIIDAGFALSYLAVLGLAGGFFALRERMNSLLGHPARRSIRAMVDLGSASLAAQIGTLPMIGLLFHRLPVIGLLGNLIAIPAFAVLLIWSVLLLLTEAIVPIMSPIVAASLNGASYLTGEFVHMLASMPLASLQISSVSPLMTGMIYVLVVILLLGLLFSRPLWVVTSILAAANLVVWGALLSPAVPACTMTFLSVGNGDATLISTPNGRNVLVDAGPSFGSETAADRILAYLNVVGIRKLDALVLTHPDNDHIGGAPGVLRVIPVRHVYTNGDTTDSRTFLDLALTAQTKGIHLETLRAGEVLRLSELCSLIVLSPDPVSFEQSETDNQRSLVCRLEANGSSALLPADIDSSAEASLLGWGRMISVDLLKAAHHGSRASNSSVFLAAASPEICIISAGKHNRYGHPHPEMLARLKQQGIPAYNTARQGAVICTASNGTWRITESPGRELARMWKLPYE